MSLVEFEKWLRINRVPFVSVREATASVTPQPVREPTESLRPFHYVLYGTVNWLVFWGSLNNANRELMEAWQELFGDGFVAVVARWRPGSAAPGFRTLGGIVTVWGEKGAVAPPSTVEPDRTTPPAKPELESAGDLPLFAMCRGR